MSRLFAFGDSVRFDAGACATIQNGAHTMAYLIKPVSCRGGFYDSYDASNVRRYGVNPFDNNIFMNTQATGFQSFDYSSIFSFWGIVGWSKSAAIEPFRYHIYSYFSNTWVHNTILGQGNMASGSGSATTFRIGSFDGAQSYEGNLAVSGYWTGRVLTDGEFETLPAALSNWVDLSPSVLLDWHNPVATPIVDIMGSGANQFQITGTTDDIGDDPPGFDYSLSTPAVSQRFLPFFA